MPWEKIADYDVFVKWAYRKNDGSMSPLRVIAHLDERRGQWAVHYASVWGPPNYLIRGNLGKAGRVKAIAFALDFIDEHPYGAAPPRDFA
jgi:hypothetical protein